MQRQMEKRYLNVYMLKEDDQLMLRFTEVQRKEKEPDTDEPENWRRMREARKPRFDRIWGDVHDKLNFEYVEHCAAVLSDNIGIKKTRSLVEYHREPYEYNEVIMPLSSNLDYLLQQLGPLDGALFYYQKFNQQNGCKIRFPQKADEFTTPMSVIYSTLVAEDQGNPKKTFTRTVAEWMISEIEKNPDTLKDYQNVLHNLREIMVEDSPSLAYPIIKKCYPGYDFEDSRIKAALESDPLKSAMFDDNKGYEEKEKLILTWIRSKLHPKLAEKGILNSVLGFFANQKASNRTPKQDIDDWFANMKVTQKHMWYKKLESLTGQLSSEGGAYARAFNPIINFLRDADLHFNESGQMVLDVNKNKSAHQGIAFDFMNLNDDGELAEKPEFEREMRHACELLGLELMPDIDFYGRFEYPFTPESTRKLMDWGFHIAKEHCQHLLKASHDYAVLEMFLRNSAGLPVMPVDLRPGLMRSAEPYLPPEDLQSMHRLRIGTK